MFERYNEKARRVIFFARYEASQFGQPYIETEHLLLGILREDKVLTSRILRSQTTVETIRRQIEKHTTIGERISTSIDMPLSKGCKRVLAYAAEEAERLGHKNIGSEHLLLALLREEGCLAQRVLAEQRVELETIREEISKGAIERPPSPARMHPGGGTASLAGLYTDLTQKATDGELQPVVARDVELESVIEVLCRKERRNPMLLGERGAGKTAIVEALAQRIANGNVPGALADKRVLAISTEALSGWAPGRERFEDLARLLGSVARSANLILFVDGLHEMVDASRKSAGQALRGVLQFALQEAEVRCIGATNEEEYRAACTIYPTLEKVFRPLHVRPLDAAGASAALRARKEKLEAFHEVMFADDALECAVLSADSYLKEKLLPGKALELLDAAGAAVKLRVGDGPPEIDGTRKRLGFAIERLATAIANHEFEKARFYSDEERKERENLAALRKKHGLEGATTATVTRADVEQVIARWASYPYSN